MASMVFCEAPLDAYGTSATAIKHLAVVSGATAAAPDAEKKRGLICGESSSSSLSATAKQQQRRAGFELAFDGLNCFDTVVMH